MNPLDIFEQAIQQARNSGLSTYEVLKCVQRVCGVSNFNYEVDKIKRERLQVQGREKRKRFSKSTYRRLFDKQKGHCPLCPRMLFIPASKNQIDHINPNRERGFNLDDNLQLVHPECNRKKSSKDVFQQSKESGKTIREIIG